MKQFLRTCKRNVRALLLAGVWVVLAALTFQFLTTLLKPKWYENDYWEAATKIEDGLYALPEDSIDVLFMGSSHAFRGFNPLELYKEYGITSYVFSGSTQRTWTTYTYLEEVLKTQSPQVVVLDAYCFFNLDQNFEERNRKQFDYLKSSKEKWEGVEEAVNEDEDVLSYYLPLTYYHSHWSGLDRDDFEYFTTDKHYYLRGYDLTFSVTAVGDDRWTYDIPADTYGVNMFYNLEENKARQWLNKICDLCTEKGIQLCFVTVPTSDWHIDEDNCVQDLANQYGFSFTDYATSEQIGRIGLDTSQDFQDNGYHLNVWGAQKFCKVLGEDLVNRYGLTDHRGGEDDAQWQDDISAYEARLAGNRLTKATTLEDYLENIQGLDDNFLICAVGQQNWKEQFDEGQISAISEALGMNTDGFDRLTYLCNYRDELRYISQKSYTLNENIDGIAINITSSGRKININGENFAKGRDGLNVVVYNKLTNEVEDSCSITRDGVVH